MNKIIHQWANFERRSDIPTQCPHAAVFASAWLFCLFLTFGITPLKAQSFNVLHGFTNSPDGANPVAGLTLDGNMLFGTAQHGGTNDNGLVFAIANDGSGYTVLHYFTNNPDGAIPHGGLALDGDTLYGTTTTGGTNPPDGGIVFSINTNGGDYTVLHNFSISDGQFPHGRMILSGDTLYGTTLGAGSTGWRSVYSMNTNGSNFTVLHTFSSPTGSSLTNWDGEQPDGGVVLADGTLYGTAYGGGTNGYGTVFSVETNGLNFMVLHAFSTASGIPLTNWDGAYSQAALVVPPWWCQTTLYMGLPSMVVERDRESCSP